MKKMKNNFVMILLIFSIPIYSGDLIIEYPCETGFIKYGISPEIKSIRGWKRVIKNNRLNEYLNMPLEEEDRQCVESCLILHGFDVKKYRRGL